MVKYVEYVDDGTIIKFGVCSEKTFNEMGKSKNVLSVSVLSNDLDRNCRIINGKIKSKTPEEIEASKPPILLPTPFEQQQARITNEQYQSMLDRLTNLETKL